MSNLFERIDGAASGRCHCDRQVDGALLTCASLAIVLAGCITTNEKPPRVETHVSRLIGGDIESEDPAVVALTSNDLPFCTGTLISPSVVLTAAHCVDMITSNTTIFFGADSFGEGTHVGVLKDHQHPGWTGSVENDHDIAMLLLDTPQSASLPVPLNTSPATQHIGADYRIVGYGVSESGGSSDGRKRSGTVTISSVRSPPNGDEIVVSDPNTVTCFGDSGGPGFLTRNNVEVVSGVHSWTTGSDCRPPGGGTRIDLYAEEFVIPWIQDTDPVCRQDWVCARRGCTSDPDCQPCGPDGTCTQDCALPDPDCPTSLIGEICQTDTQCVTGFCEPWFADPSTKFCSTECVPGDSSCTNGTVCQSVPERGDICYFERTPPGVVGAACKQHTDCGSYLCDTDNNVCVSRCDPAVGLACPDGFECHEGKESLCRAGEQQDDGCASNRTPGRGGCLLLVAIAVRLPARRLKRRDLEG